jgi:hypothetical protein
MSDAWDGRPQNPERDGWHWLCAAVGTGAPYPMLWCADGKAWDTGDGWIFCTDPALIERRRYLGPCLTPDEIAAREAASAEAMREACAAWHDYQAEQWKKADPHHGAHRRHAGHASYIRALPLPHASALARAEKAAYQRGWNDRESDFLAGVERTGMTVVGPDALAAAEKRGMERAAKLLADWPVDDERITVEECIAIIRNAAAQESEG